MYKELNNLTVTTGKRFYRTKENRPNRANIMDALRTTNSMDEMETLCREFLNATRVNDIIDRHEKLINKCMALIQEYTETGMIITKKHMANYLRREHNITGDGAHYGHADDPCGATEYALERLVEKGYLKKVKVRHTMDFSWRANTLDAYEVI